MVIKKDKIVFELTERQTIKNLSLLEKFSQDLMRRGFNLAIDDFGSGYSSFYCFLSRLPHREAGARLYGVCGHSEARVT